MIKCKDCKHLKETELGGQTYYECLKIWNVEIHDKNFEHLCNQYETKVNDVDTSHDKALHLRGVIKRKWWNEFHFGWAFAWCLALLFFAAFSFMFL